MRVVPYWYSPSIILRRRLTILVVISLRPVMDFPRPTLADVLGYCSAIAWCGILLYQLFVGWRRSRADHDRLPMLAVALALLWNIGELAVLRSGIAISFAEQVLHAIGFAALNFLPAVLLHIGLGRHARSICVNGYGVSFTAAALYFWACFSGWASPHRLAVLLTTVGFAILTAASVVTKRREKSDALRLLAAIGLLLVAIFFVSLGGRGRHIHLVGIPLTLLILLPDYRFLFVSAFLRFSVKGALASGMVFSAFAMESRFHLIHGAEEDPFEVALVLIATCVVLLGLPLLSERLETFLTRLTFHRPDAEPVVAALCVPKIEKDTEEHYLSYVRDTLEKFFECRLSLFERHLQVQDLENLPDSFALLKSWSIFPSAPWAEAALPLRFSRGDALVLLLGPRRGRRPYSREDGLLSARFGRMIEQQIEHRRHLEMQNLASQAELKALHAQINPHFLFNSLTTLYGTISRDNADAKRLVLKLADLLRYFLRSDRMFVTLEEELKIVRAYMEIQALRLGPKFASAIHVSEGLLDAEVPVLTIQPLVENAIKHGVASSNPQGSVCLKVRAENSHLCVEVMNTGGEFRLDDGSGDGEGIGLANVQRRLKLCYGSDTEFYISSRHDQTIVGFFIPLIRPNLGSLDRIDLPDEMQQTA